MTIALTTEQVEAYRQDGYIVVESLIDSATVASLLDRIRQYTHGERPADRLTVQVEPKIQRGELAVEHPGDGIRKIDGLMESDDQFRQLGTSDRVVSVLEPLIGPDIRVFRNTLMLKPPEVGSPKGWHQDSPYWPIEPMDLCSCWLPLDDATLENGCMVVLPGLHRGEPLPHVHVTDDFVIEPDRIDASAGVAVPMKSGSGLFFHSLLPHFTAPNTSTRWRRAMVLSYMSSRSRFTGDGQGPEYLVVRGRTYEGCVR